MTHLLKLAKNSSPWLLWTTLLLALVALISNSETSVLIVPSAKAATDSQSNFVNRPPSAPAQQSASADGIWQDASEEQLEKQGGERFIYAQNYRLVVADLAALDRVLAKAPTEGSAAPQSAEIVLTLPLPDGRFERFRLEEYPLMAPELAAKFPQITTYRGWGLDDPSATARLDRTPAGFHGLIWGNSYTVYIDPFRRGDTTHYMSYYQHDYINHWGKQAIEQAPLLNPAYQPKDTVGIAQSSGPQRRTYRLAVAATVEYTTFHSNPNPPSQAAGLAAIVTTVNRITGIYERELSVSFQLVANNNVIVFTAEPDGYTDGDDNQMVTANQGILDANIGNGNYDIGHVFGVNGAGVASLGSVCRNFDKAEGVSQSNPPVGDPFDVDYAAHEMGHQFGGNHSYNAEGAGGCTTRNAATAFEPASGVTIMSYVGICATQNLQANSLAHFHAVSFNEMRTFITDPTGGAACGTQTATGNAAPVVNAGPDYTIPKQTPFTLSGSATDAQALIYSWEEFDAPTAAWVNAGVLPNTDADGQIRPIFRSFTPAGSGARTFPTLVNILDGTNQNIGESLPNINRSMTFRLTARDNLGGVAHDDTSITVYSPAGPFAVTNPNTAITWNGSPQTVSWNVAGTTAAPINCANVNILLSTNGGQTFLTPLATNTANDGSESVTLPANKDTTTARVKVQCAGNIFFDLSNANFTITGTGGPATDGNIFLPVILK